MQNHIELRRAQKIFLIVLVSVGIFFTTTFFASERNFQSINILMQYSKSDPQFCVREILENKNPTNIGEISQVPGGIAFIEKFVNFEKIFDLQFQDFDRGFVAKFSGFDESKVVENYEVKFFVKRNEIEKIEI